jgi:uncharacterized protein with PIN domain
MRQAKPRLRGVEPKPDSAFSRCAACGRVYWRGAHSKRLEAIVESAVRAVSAAGARHHQ